MYGIYNYYSFMFIILLFSKNVFFLYIDHMTSTAYIYYWTHNGKSSNIWYIMFFLPVLYSNICNRTCSYIYVMKVIS
jgi:hypothetical protein